MGKSLKIDKPFKTSERDFRQMVMSLAKINGWKYYFTWNSQHSVVGFPDMFFCRVKVDAQARNDCDVHGEMFFAELKSDNGKLSPAQVEWLSILKMCGCETHCWFPKDWDKIVERLKR
jgi:hypothetical protein